MSELTTRTAMATVEAAYSLEGTDAAWLERILGVAAADLDRGLGLYGATGCLVSGSLVPRPPLAAHALDPACLAHAQTLHPRLPCPILDAFAPRAVVIGGLDEAWPRKLAAADLYRVGMEGAGVRDALVLYARGGEDTVVKIVAPARSAVVTHPRARATWGRVMQHIAAALRLRRKVARGDAPEAVVDPSGHLTRVRLGLAGDERRRGRVLSELRRVMQARAAASGDPARALEAFSALLAGRYSVVDRWEEDGRRYLALFGNTPLAPGRNSDLRGLGKTELRVAELVAHGASLKESSYALGITKTAAQRALALALRKLGLAHASELSPLFVGARVAAPVQLGGASLEVLAATMTAQVGAEVDLTSAEREVAEAVLRGMSDADIARRRGTSARTVANQLRQVFAKLGVHSRGELRARLLEGEPARASTTTPLRGERMRAG